MYFNLRIYSGIASILFAFICSLLRLKKGGRSVMWLSAFLGITFLTEAVAAYCNFRYHFNLYVYNIMGPVMMLCSALYFNYSNSSLRCRHIGWYAGVGGFVFTALNSIFFEPLNTLNTNFESLECVCMCAFALSYFYSLYYKDHNYRLMRDPHFWIAFLFLFFYAGTFMARAGIEVLKHYSVNGRMSVKTYQIVFAMVLAFYSGLGVVFLTFKNFGDEQ